MKPLLAFFHNIKKTLFFSTALLLTACVSSPQLSVPEAITHNNSSYYLISQQDLGSVARYFYVPKGESAEHWHSAIELLQDRNWQQRTLVDRIALRKQVYQNTGVTHFDLYPHNNELLTFVIYEPTEQNKDWQVNVARGKDLPFCGFVQYQYSLKIAKNKKLMNMKKEKIIKYLQKYVVNKEIQNLSNSHFSWNCKK
ncbi:hypothetical protein ACIWO4_01575 [Avibacterium paragallinarum]|uniref:hypothetical protein n=1 Tax=Avibacterium paragallinarum TaxID=728 RepID=UPI003987211F